MRYRLTRTTLAACLYSLALWATAGCSLTPSLPKWQWPWVARRQELDRALSVARLTERQGNLDEAMITYRKILEADPDNVLAHHRVGAVAVKERRFEDARMSFETAMRLAEPSAELLNDVGYLHYLRQDLPNAEALFRQSLTKEPRNKLARNNLGLALAEQGRFDEALAEFRQVGTEAEAFSNLAYIQVKIGELGEAEKNCHKALALDSNLRPAAEALMQVADLKAKATGTVPPSMISKVYSDPPGQRPADGLGAGNSIVESVRGRDEAPGPGGRNARRSLSSGAGELQAAGYAEPLAAPSAARAAPSPPLNPGFQQPRSVPPTYAPSMPSSGPNNARDNMSANGRPPSSTNTRPPNMSQTMPPNMQPNMQPNMRPNLPANMTPNFPPDLSPAPPPNVPPNVPPMAVGAPSPFR